MTIEEATRELEPNTARRINLAELLKAARDVLRKRGGYSTTPEQMLMLDIDFALEAEGYQVKTIKRDWVDR